MNRAHKTRRQEKAHASTAIARVNLVPGDVRPWHYDDPTHGNNKDPRETSHGPPPYDAATATGMYDLY